MDIKRIASGIQGLDDILLGGLLAGRIYLIEGTSGTGKTILANQVCFHHVQSGNRAVFMTLLAEGHGHMLENLSTLGFYDDTKVADTLHYVSAYQALEQDGLEALIEFIAAAKKKFNATLLVIDGFSICREFAKSDIEYMRFVQKLCALLHLERCTTLLLSSASNSHRSEHAYVDGLIGLTFTLHQLRAVRELEIHKTRGSDQLAGKHFFDICQNGIVVYPRLEQLFQYASAERKQFIHEKAGFTSPSINKILNGGIPRYSTTTLLGPSGAGKTLFGLDFLAAGANEGETSFYFGFYEEPSRLVAFADEIGLDFSKHVDSGKIHIQWQIPLEETLDKLGHRLLKKLAEHKPERLFIDGIDAMYASAVYPQRITRYLAALSNRLRELRITTFISEEMPLFTQEIKSPITDMSAIMENAILLRYVEVNSQLYRLISILKVRGNSYDTSLREFCISDQGLRVGAPFKDADAVLTGRARFRPFQDDSIE